MAEEQATDEQQPPADTVGARLRLAREARGLSRPDIAALTRIAERHLAAIEEDRFADLASRTYAVGFSRTYARAVGLDEFAIADAVRTRLDSSKSAWEPTKTAVFEPGDPARVPPSRVAWLAALGAIAVVVLVYLLWRSYYDPAVSLPDLADDRPAAAPPASSGAPANAASSAGAPVVFTATAPGVWVKFYDGADGVQLLQKELAQGETFTVPATARQPLLWTARPDALAITVGGRAVPLLSERQMTMKDVPVSAAALLGRGQAPGAPASAPAAAPASARAALPAAVPAAVSASAPRAGAPARSPARQPAAAPASAPAALPPAVSAPATAAQPSTVSD